MELKLEEDEEDSAMEGVKREGEAFGLQKMGSDAKVKREQQRK